MILRLSALGVGLLTMIGSWMLLDAEPDMSKYPLELSSEERDVIRAEIASELAGRVSDVPVPVDAFRSTSTKSAETTTTTTLVPPYARCPQWWVVAVGAGWPADPALLEVLDWVIWRESRCQSDAVGDGSYGLTQIQWSVHADWIGLLGFERDELLEPAVNLAMAWHLYRVVDADPDYDCGFSPWYMSQPGRHWCRVLEDLL